jgi:protein tyrosine/serine phosphatase
MFVSNWDNKDIAESKPPVKTKQLELQALVRKIMELKFKINKDYTKYQVAYKTTTEEDAKIEVDKIKANLRLKNVCGIINFTDSKNELNINIKGMKCIDSKQPDIDENGKSITVRVLNEKKIETLNATKYGIHINLKPETANAEQYIVKEDVTYFSIPIEDYTCPTEEQFIEFFNIINRNKESPKIMHCGAGLGRTGIMLLSYVWLDMYKNNKDMKDQTDVIAKEEIPDIPTKRRDEHGDAIISQTSLYDQLKISFPLIETLEQSQQKFYKLSFHEIFREYISSGKGFNEFKDNLLARRIITMAKAIKQYVGSVAVVNDVIGVDSSKIKYIKYKTKYIKLKEKMNNE